MLKGLAVAAMLAIGVLAVPVCAVAGGCGEAPPALDDWEVAAPDAVGLDPAALCAIGTRLADPSRPNLHSVLVARHGKLVYEAYAAGRDERWRADLGVVANDAGRLHDMRSVTKSVVSLLVGIALDRGLVTSLDAPAAGFFPGVDGLDPAMGRITLDHLLNMTPGLRWNEGGPWASPANDERLMYEAPDPYRYVLTRPVAAPPGTRWEYTSGATVLLAGVLRAASGARLEAFAREALFEPLGISEVEWIAMANGEPAAGGGLRLRPRDMAKIGQLVLDGGRWRGRQVVSQAWIARSTAPRYEGWPPLRYGSHWWIGQTLRGADRIDWIAAIGLGGQRLFIVPALDLVIASTAGLYRAESQGYYARAILEEDVIPAIRDAPPAQGAR